MSKSDPTLHQAKIVPDKHFDSPMSVVEDGLLSVEEKLKILESWELDARELQAAESENMAGGERSRLDEVREAVRQLKERNA